MQYGTKLMFVLPPPIKECNYEICTNQTNLNFDQIIVNSINIYVFQ
jgi:hypothetical protein